MTACVALATVACASPTVGNEPGDAAGLADVEAAPDVTAADAATPDAGPVDAAPIDTGLLLSRGSLAPASAGSVSAAHVLRGNLRPSEVHTSSAARYRLRGGLVPQGH